ncbi:Hypothetical_protein [Hexamita inflata]|uniref:Hypothetical_protein n=1 Tax=Hexamita inflata TaxID=28002 RepID=A0AA86NZ09_9EUKA|nr:Hypothetical protein HINF_LOCUS16917 [Hexamita inflata]
MFPNNIIPIQFNTFQSLPSKQNSMKSSSSNSSSWPCSSVSNSSPCTFFSPTSLCASILLSSTSNKSCLGLTVSQKLVCSLNTILEPLEWKSLTFTFSIC